MTNKLSDVSRKHLSLPRLTAPPCPDPPPPWPWQTAPWPAQLAAPRAVSEWGRGQSSAGPRSGSEPPRPPVPLQACPTQPPAHLHRSSEHCIANNVSAPVLIFNANLSKCCWAGNCFGDLICEFLLLTYIIHHVMNLKIYLRIIWKSASLFLTSSTSSWWAFFIALAASPMAESTAVLALALSRASLWFSIVFMVPSICRSWASNLNNSVATHMYWQNF